MDVLQNDISAMVFRCAMKGRHQEFYLNNSMLRVLIELDGKKKAGAIAKEIGLDVDELGKIITSLLKLNLIELSEDTTQVLDKDFLDYLNAELLLAIGPMSEILIEDAVTDLGRECSSFPTQGAAELVVLLARQIQSEKKRRDFKQNLVNKLMEKGY